MIKVTKLDKEENNTNGITLIALVITIIVLLILTVVSITALTGENGLLTKANKSKEDTELANAREQIKLAMMEWQIEKATNPNANFKEFLEKKFGENKVREKGSNCEIEIDRFTFVVTPDGEILSVGEKEKGIKITKDGEEVTNIELEKGDIVVLDAVVELENVTNEQIEWIIEDETKIIRNEETGEIQAKEIGETRITAKIVGTSISTTCTMKVTEIAAPEAFSIGISNIQTTSFVINAETTSRHKVDYFECYIGNTLTDTILATESKEGELMHYSISASVECSVPSSGFVDAYVVAVCERGSRKASTNRAKIYFSHEHSDSCYYVEEIDHGIADFTWKSQGWWFDSTVSGLYNFYSTVLRKQFLYPCFS